MEKERISLRSVKELLSRDQMKQVRAGSGGGNFCGDRGSASNCPEGTTPKYCDALNAAYCQDERGVCATYGTAVCT